MNNKQNITGIELTDFEAQDFILFQQHRELFEALKKTDSLSVKGGNVTIHFSSFGDVVGIDKKEHYNILREHN